MSFFLGHSVQKLSINKDSKSIDRSEVQVYNQTNMSQAQLNFAKLQSDSPGNNPFTENNEMDRRQLLVYAKGLIRATVLIVLGQFIVIWSNNADASKVILGAVLFLLLMTLVGRTLIIDKRPRPGVAAIVTGLFIAAVICVMADPKIMTVSVFAALLAVGLAMPFVSSQELKRICFIGEIAIVGIGVLGTFFNYFNHEVSLVSNIAMLIALLLAAQVSLSWLHSFHQRLYDLVNALRFERQNLEGKVAERTVELRKELNHAKELEVELRKTRETLVIATEDERRRLRRELHDEFSPALSGCLLTLANLKETLPQAEPSAQAAIDRVSQSLTILRTEVRQLSYQLLPEFLDLGLMPAVEQLVDRFCAQNPRIKVEVMLAENLPELPAAIERAAYHFVQGALQNIQNHSHATWCQVSLAITSCNDTPQQGLSDHYLLQLKINDDGIGFKPDHRLGVGMISMRERAEMLSGQFNYSNRTPSGTQLEMQIPFHVAQMGQISER